MTKINDQIQSDSRRRIEAVLKESAEPLSAFDIARLSGVSLSITRTHLSQAVHKHRAYNANPNKRNQSRYGWGRPQVTAVSQPRTYIPEGTYTPPEIHTRSGSQDFLSMPSLRSGSRVAYRLPISMAGGGE
jgi:hypothetical protein